MLNDVCWNILRRNIVFVKIENNTDSDIYFYWDKTGNGTLSEDRMDPEYIPKQKQWFVSTLKLKVIKLFFLAILWERAGKVSVFSFWHVFCRVHNVKGEWFQGKVMSAHSPLNVRSMAIDALCNG